MRYCTCNIETSKIIVLTLKIGKSFNSVETDTLAKALFSKNEIKKDRKADKTLRFSIGEIKAISNTINGLF